jgi:uncharacterized protein (DUF885 family)
VTARLDLDRRQLLLSGVAACLSVVPRAGFAQTPRDKLNRLFDSFANSDLDASPEAATSLGMDRGARARHRRKLDDRTRAFMVGDKARIAEQLRQLLAFDPTPLRGLDRINYDVVLFALRSTDAANRRYEYGPVGAGAPYVLSHLTGAYVTIPDFLEGQHEIGSRADADAYLLRLEAFATTLDQEIDTVRRDMALGCTPPDFTLARTREQMMKLRNVAPHDAGLVTSLAQRIRQKAIAGGHAAEAERIVRERLYPALDRQIALAYDMQVRATHDAGVWKLKNGDDYYADSLTIWTTSSLSPAEIHKLGLDTVAECASRIDGAMKQQGTAKGTVGERLRAMFDDPRFRYPDTEAGKDKLLADLNAKVRLVRSKLPQFFGVLPKAGVVVKRVPGYMEAARPGGYYQPPSLDGKRPGIYYINLRNTAETPSWVLPNSTYHQSIPGHHVKYSVYQEARLPLIRKLPRFSAYLEGWSLYAAQLADEMGMYANDPLGRIGYLRGELLCAVRLVVDTGMHAMRWSRERALAYYTQALGDPAASAQTEIERYCIWPGQACCYLLDKLAILRLRSKAKTALGPRFDIRQFHDAILLCGAAPQQVLETAVDGYVRSKAG